MTRTSEILPLDDAPPPADLCERVTSLLERGEVVAMPTETVYGLAARADDPAALAALRAVKARPGTPAPDRPWTWHIGDRSVCERTELFTPPARRLAERYWPGPLTLVLPGVPSGLEHVAQSDWVGIRFPAHSGTAGLLAAADFPVVLTSANRHGDPPSVLASEIARDLGPGVALILDGGPARMGEPSGVLRIGNGSFELLREGLLPIEDLRRTAGRRIAFVCTGNTCRSPMAAALASRRIVERLGGTPGDAASERKLLAQFGFQVRSMGVYAGAGQPAAEHAIELLGARGIDLSRHRSSPALSEEIADCDEVYALTRSHLDALIGSLPPGRADHVQLLDPEGSSVGDPIGGTLETYRRCAEEMENMILARLDDWA